MKIFYLCPTGLHTGLVAAGIHLGRIPADKPPAGEEMSKLVREYRRHDYMLGKPVIIGRDDAGHEVFTVGVAGENAIIKKAINDLLKRVYKIRPDEYLVVDTVGLTNNWVRLGSLLSLRLNLSGVGAKICAFGIRKRYNDVVKTVKRVKMNITSQAE